MRVVTEKTAPEIRRSGSPRRALAPGYNRGNMPRKMLALCLLLVAAAFGHGEQSKQSNVLLAELITLGKTKDDRPTLTASVRLTNKGTGYVSVLLVGRPSAVDDAGGVFEVENVAGIAYCMSRQR